MWLYGSAGCGKTAVAQTFAEHCVKVRRLGAAFFFSRPNKRNNPKTVIPTIAYQLAVSCGDYRLILTSRLAEDPQVLSKALSVQFKSLLVEPLTYLQQRGYKSVKRPFVIILDGLDECQGEGIQSELIRLINELVRVKRDFPLFWLICSRPEAHLRFIFARITDCGHEELEIDEQCRKDVDSFLRDGLYDLQVKYNLGSSWPPSEQFKVVSENGSGLFIFASTAIAFVGNDEYANPPRRLDRLVAFLKHAEGAGVANPLVKLDYLYSRILADISPDIFPSAWRILAHDIYTCEIPVDGNAARFLYKSAQALSNFLGFDQATFYGTLRKLYSVIDVPPPEKAATTPLRFYHASFQDFLVNPRRSKGFAIERKKAFVDIAATLLFWHEVDSRHFHIDDGEFLIPNAYWYSYSC